MIQVIPSQVAKLIPRLASDQDGEVVATARAIGRVLQSAGLDWHDVAARTAAPDPIIEIFGSAEREAPEPSRPQSPPPSPPKPREPGWSDLRRSEQLAWCFVLLAEMKLDDKAARLVTAVRDKLHIGQNFYLAPRHKRQLTGLVKAAKAQGLRT